MSRTLRRLRPMGAFLPRPLTVKAIRAWLIGFRDGWQQPYDLGSSTNVDHLKADENYVYDAQDRGINAGQWLRSPLNHQQD